MIRILLATFVLTSSVALTGCCSTCGGKSLTHHGKHWGCKDSCGGEQCGGCGDCGHHCGYWRNLGKGGCKPVGCASCRKCDLCEDVGGPCGGWAQTSMNPPADMYGPEGYYPEDVMEGPMPPSHSRMTRQGQLRSPGRVAVRPVRTRY